jgi:hypothetical protein
LRTSDKEGATTHGRYVFIGKDVRRRRAPRKVVNGIAVFLHDILVRSSITSEQSYREIKTNVLGIYDADES